MLLRLLRLSTLAALAALGFLAAPAQAASRNVKATLVAETDAVQPGRPFWVGLRLEMAPHWHTYWKNPGDSGLPTKIKWTLPEGFSAGPLVWPRPDRIAAGPLMSYGYEGEVLLLTEVTPPATLAAGSSVTLAGRADWLECKEACLPGKADVQVELPVRADTPGPSAQAGLFEATRRHLPVEAAGWKAKAHAGTREIVLALEPPSLLASSLADAYFYPEDQQVLDYPATQSFAPASAGHRLTLVRAPDGASPETLRGVLVLKAKSGDAVAVNLAAPVTSAPPPAVAAGATALVSGGSTVGEAAAPGAQTATTEKPGGADRLGLLGALLFAFLGGLVLNLMPCVLPVLSLKVLGFVHQAGQDRSRAWRHGAAFTAGVLVFFWVLAGALIALRAGGAQIGWGFQLQSPPFVVFLTCLFFVLGLNLFGVFEVGQSLTAAGGLTAGKSGLASSFWSGALATIVATPCTAPFMGSALGFALGQSATVAMLVFTFLGLGMAAPYFVLSLFPALVRFVPRPGAWMETFKHVMGFFLMATVVALVWLFGRQTGVDGVTFLLAALLVVAMGAYVYGRATGPETTPRRRLLGRLAAAGLVTAGVVIGLSQAQAAPEARRGAGGTSGEGIAWEPFSPERLAELRAAGTPVFVDFTADWCLTCQVNERVALRTAAVQERFRQTGVVALKADWTLKDARITEALAGHGRQGVPLYVLYGKGQGPARLLPEVITPAIVLEAFDQTFKE